MFTQKKTKCVRAGPHVLINTIASFELVEYTVE